MEIQTAIEHLVQGTEFGNSFRTIRWLKGHIEGDHEIHLLMEKNTIELLGGIKHIILKVS